MKFPNKLKSDAIVTTAFEIRFHTDEIEEIVVGRMAEWAHSKFPNVSKKRTGAADIPLAVRQANPAFMNQSVLDIEVDYPPASSRYIRVGNSVLGYILRGQYCGWQNFETELFDAIDALFREVPVDKVSRLGLRYTNALRPDLHFINGIADLNLSVMLNNDEIIETVSTNYVINVADNHQVACRVCTPNFWNEALPEGTAVVADFDVSSRIEMETFRGDHVREWVSDAHRYEIDAFASILPCEIIEKLRDE